MISTQDIIKEGYKNCPICNKPPLFIFDNQYNWGIGCCSTGIVAHSINESVRLWNTYAEGHFKPRYPHGLGLVYSSNVFIVMGCNSIDWYTGFDIKKVCKYKKRTCNTNSEDCWCNPKIEIYPNGNKLIIHNEDI